MRAALRMWALVSMWAGALPGPTPMAGFPDEYAALTMGPPPVAITTATWGERIKATTSGRLGRYMHSMSPGGSACRMRLSVEFSGRVIAASTGCGVRGDHDGVATEQRQHDLVVHGRNGVGGGCQRQHDARRFGNLDHLAGFVHAGVYQVEVAIEVQQRVSDRLVLFLFVLDHPVASFPHRPFGVKRRVVMSRLGNGLG